VVPYLDSRRYPNHPASIHRLRRRFQPPGRERVQ
jgi:hypothetical protein